MVKTRKFIEAMYNGTCTITEQKKVRNPNKSTSFQEVVVVENQPCRLSFSNISNAVQTETAAAIGQVVKVFIAPEIKVNPGSKLTITQNDVTTDYKCSGEPAFYMTHQEIVLELFKGWS